MKPAGAIEAAVRRLCDDFEHQINKSISEHDSIDLVTYIKLITLEKRILTLPEINTLLEHLRARLSGFRCFLPTTAKRKKKAESYQELKIFLMTLRLVLNCKLEAAAA